MYLTLDLLLVHPLLLALLRPLVHLLDVLLGHCCAQLVNVLVDIEVVAEGDALD